MRKAYKAFNGSPANQRGYAGFLFLQNHPAMKTLRNEPFHPI